jgi:hypothetical protein
MVTWAVTIKAGPRFTCFRTGQIGDAEVGGKEAGERAKGRAHCEKGTRGGQLKRIRSDL